MPEHIKKSNLPNSETKILWTHKTKINWSQNDAAKLIEWCFTLQIDNDPKHTARQPKSVSRQRNGIFFNCYVSHLTSVQPSILLTH